MGDAKPKAELREEFSGPGQGQAMAENIRASDPGRRRPAGLDAETLQEGPLEGADGSKGQYLRGEQVRACVEGLIGNPD